jgi:P-type conjugative transfer protein TrbG
MKLALAAAAVALPMLAHAQTVVPAILTGAGAGAATAAPATATSSAPARLVAGDGVASGTASASAVASASAATAGATTFAPASSPSDSQGAVPRGMPPPLPLLSPSARLNAKEAHATALARRWANARYMPHAGADGVIRFPYGATLPTVVCAPLQVCDLALQPGEVVQLPIHLGDKVRWLLSPGISGSPDGPVTHIVIKATDAGLQSSMTVNTNRRTYSVKLVSTQTQWMPLTAFSYPDDQQAQWGAYQQAMGAGSFAAAPGASAAGGNLAFFTPRCQGSPPWAPLRAWTDGTHTYVEFASLPTSDAPALVGLANDGGWFGRPTSQVVNYRPVGNRLVADAALQRFALVSGVGGGHEQCTFTREASR